MSAEERPTPEQRAKWEHLLAGMNRADRRAFLRDERRAPARVAGQR